MAIRIADEYSVSTTTLYAIVEGETGGTWNPNQVCDGGDGRGLVCVNKRYFPEEYEKALDPEFSLRFASQLILKHEEWKFTLCSCISTAKMLGVPIPKFMSAENLTPNGTPHEGDLLLLKYKNVYHVAKVIERNEKEEFYIIKEGNFKKCQMTTRKIPFNDPAIRGGWIPSKEG